MPISCSLSREQEICFFDISGEESVKLKVDDTCNATSEVRLFVERFGPTKASSENMDISSVIMLTGFILASYSVVGNDVIQTLGTFLSSNEKRPWWVLFLFAGSILAATLVYGWLDPSETYKYGIAYGRLDKFDIPTTLSWYYLLPPLVLLSLTRMGIPVSTTFMILTLFSLSSIDGNNVLEIVTALFDFDSKLGGMVQKSLMGYIIAFGAALLLYLMTTQLVERQFLDSPLQDKTRTLWTVAQWCSTGFLWWQWLTQDLANIYIYLLGGGQLSPTLFFTSLVIILILLGAIFYSKGGAVQKIVKAKINTTDIRSATIVDFIYGLILYIFKYDSLGLWGAKLPMSTTWVFIGLLAGREIGMRIQLEKKVSKLTLLDISRDLLKVLTGLVISVLLVIVIKFIGN